MFTFTKHTEEECTKMGLLEKGNYEFTVRAALNQTAKASGAPMVKLELSIEQMGKEHVVYDYLLDALPYKLRHFMYSVGLSDDYESEKVDTRKFIGLRGICKVYVKEDKTGQYQPQNAVADYLVDNGQIKMAETNTAEAKAGESFADDPIPF